MATSILSPKELKYINFGPGAGWVGVRGQAVGNLAPGNATPYPTVNGIDPNWTIQRSYWCFDTINDDPTQSIPSFAKITGARLKLHGCGAVGYPGPGTAEIWFGGAYPSQPFVASDFDISLYNPSVNNEHFTIQNGMAGDQTLTIINPAAIIVPYIAGGFRFAILLDVDANNPAAPPADGTYTFIFGGLADVGSEPTLEVDWEVELKGIFMRSDGSGP